MYRRGLVVVPFLALVLGCSDARAPTPAPPPTRDAALGLLDAIVDAALAGDIETVCSHGVGTCAQSLRDSDPRAIPSSGPTVVASRTVAPTRSRQGGLLAGGHLLGLCGIDGLGARYYSEMLVISEPDRLVAVNAPFWLGYRVGLEWTTEHADPLAPCPSGLGPESSPPA
jgi:hypothetical protein